MMRPGCSSACRRKVLLAILFIGIHWCVYSKAQTIEIISLQSRTVNELIPILQPFVAPGGILSGDGYQLIVKTTPDNLQQLREMLAQLDVAPQMMIITVRQGEALVSGKADGIMNREFISTSKQEDTGAYQTLQVQDGHEAFIRLGQSKPIITHYQNFAGEKMADIAYHDVTSGFSVTPYMRGNQVELRIKKHSAKPSADGGANIDTSTVQTVLTVPMGKWINIAGTTAVDQQHGQDLILTTRSHDQSQMNVYIKVDWVKSH